MKIEDSVALNIKRFSPLAKEVKGMLRAFERDGLFEPEFTAEEYETAYKEIEEAKNLGVKIIPFDSDDFPEQFKKIKDPPILIYQKGELRKSDTLAVSIVGSRKCTEYGKSISRHISYELASLGITIVSGMAYGIDTEAHLGAIDANGRTVATFGSGIDVIYPKSNESVYKKIIEHGAVISEFPLHFKPNAYNFPFRNRLISGFSLATVVIEAKERSGSLITANFAVEQGKEVFAVPGNITSALSKGTNMLIKDGAIPFLEISDILEDIPQFVTLRKDRPSPMLSQEEESVLEVLQNDTETLDKIAEKTGIDFLKLISILAQMEIKGLVKKVAGRYTKIYED